MYYFPIAIAEPPPRGSQPKWQMGYFVSNEMFQFYYQIFHKEGPNRFIKLKYPAFSKNLHVEV